MMKKDAYKGILLTILGGIARGFEVLGPILFYLFIGGIVLSVLALPFVLIAGLIDYVRYGDLSKDIEPFSKTASDTAYYIDNILREASNFISKFLIEYPYLTLILLFILIFLIIKITLKRKNDTDITRNIILIAIISYLVYVLATYEEIDYKSFSNFLSIYISSLLSFITQNSHTNIVVSFAREEVLLILYLVFSYLLNSRLLWIFSIFLLQVFSIYTYYSVLTNWVDQQPPNYYRLLQGVIPTLIVAPYMLAIWIFRDNDKYSDFHQKERELLVRRRETRIKEKELENKITELDIRRQELKLKEREVDNKT